MAWLRKWIFRSEVMIALAVMLVMAWFGSRAFLFDYYRVPSQSMYPTIRPGAFVVVDKRGYGNYGLFGRVFVHASVTAPIERTDIIVSKLVEDPSISFVHRVIGLPGDHVSMKDKRLEINGTSVPLEPGATDETHQYAIETIDGHPISVAYMPERLSRDIDVVVPEEHLFVLGDNRDNARDSRFIGFVPKENIIGRVIHVLRTGK